MRHYVSYCVPGSRMLIHADLCLIMLIYNRATETLLTVCGAAAAAAAAPLPLFSGRSFGLLFK